LRDRVLFGTDYPFITHQQWFDAFATHDVDPETQEAILRGNAARLLDL
jgi:predicted TIM-barrel fold metal-dependent hydrolase